ncbi:MAG: hypothetical protein M3Z27_00100 [Actinomycetota bacterium]|nr:hypothetical protein [Actinomycetota bacterium]
MQLAATDPNESLDELAARVYDLGLKPTAAVTEAATKALLEANPFLSELKAVAAGTVIDVPPLPGAGPAPGATRTEQATAVDLVLDRVRSAVALAQRQLFADIDAETRDAEAAITLGRSAELNQLRSVTPGLAGALPGTISAAQERAAAAERLRGRQSAVCQQIVSDLAELARAFEGGVERTGHDGA